MVLSTTLQPGREPAGQCHSRACVFTRGGFLRTHCRYLHLAAQVLVLVLVPMAPMVPPPLLLLLLLLLCVAAGLKSHVGT